MSLRVAAVIPARYDSSRLPGKPLIKLAGKEMILRVAERVQRASHIDTVCVATDDERVRRCVEEAGYFVMMTRRDHSSGTSRIIEVSRHLDADIYVNVQGDEPLIPESTINAVVEPMLMDLRIDVSTVRTKLPSAEMAADPNRTKVVVNNDSYAMYFSRAMIPYNRDNMEGIDYYLHIGIYAFRAAALCRFETLTSHYETVEKLEQLRWLENNIPIYVATVDRISVGVDTPEDVKQVEEILRRDVDRL